MARVVKLAKVSIWTKDMMLETLKRQLAIWKSSNVDVPDNTQFQDLVELLKLNKDLKVLRKCVSEHILTVLDTVDKQEIGEVMECLKKCYGRTRLEKIEKLIVKWINFREDDFDDEDYLLQARMETQ